MRGYIISELTSNFLKNIKIKWNRILYINGINRGYITSLTSDRAF